MSEGARYRAGQQRFIGLLRQVPDDLGIPATPDWTAHGLLSHVVGVAADLVARRVDRWSQPSWTAEQVDARVRHSRDALTAEWNEHVEAVVAIVDDPSAYGLDDMFRRVPLIDVIAHEYDVREAVGDTEVLGDIDWAMLSAHRRFWLDAFIKAADLPPARITTDLGDEWVVGGEAPRAEVHVPRHELWRSLEGRRTRDAVRAFEWSVDPEPYLACWLGPAFAWPDDRS